MINYGFDSIKLDNCGVQKDLNKWASIMGELNKPILIENCHWGLTLPNATWCPFNTCTFLLIYFLFYLRSFISRY